MTRNGLVTKAESDAGQKRKRYRYSITDAGKQELLAWLQKPVEKEDVKYEILLKLNFGSLAGAAVNQALIRDFQARYAAELPQLQLFERNLRAVSGESDDHLYYLLTVLLGEKVYQAYLDWAAEALALLESSMRKESES